MNNQLINRIITQAKKENRTLLTEVESKQVMAQAGLAVVETRLATTKKEAASLSEKLGYPVAMKVISPEITHKSDGGGVVLGIKTKEEALEAYDGIITAAQGRFPKANILGISVQKMAKPGTEVIIGMFTDRQFGPVLMFGLGGILVELLKDVSFRIVPLTKFDARTMIQSIKGYPLLNGYRGRELVDTVNLENWLINISEFVHTHPEIKEFDLNPVIAYSDGAVVVDARVLIS
jgi:acyl-CoA synthetase (NDP forming)